METCTLAPLSSICNGKLRFHTIQDRCSIRKKSSYCPLHTLRPALTQFTMLTLFTRPVHKKFSFQFPKLQGRFILHLDRWTNVRKGDLLKYRSFIKFQETPILQGRIHETELLELGFGHNFPLECTSDLKQAFLSWILRALFMDTPLAHLSCYLAQRTWHLEFLVPGAREFF